MNKQYYLSLYCGTEKRTDYFYANNVVVIESKKPKEIKMGVGFRFWRIFLFMDV
jgi:hypothetical protein